MIELHAIFYGRVQGVFFRDTTQRYAQKLGLVGEVRNLSDGTVELLVQGVRKQIDQLVDMLTGDSGPGIVESVEKIYRPLSRSFDGFAIVY